MNRAYHQTVKPEVCQLAEPLTERQQQTQQCRERRVANYEQVHQLRQQGLSVPDIAIIWQWGIARSFAISPVRKFSEWQPHLLDDNTTGE